jgi:hypothetical protein
VSWQQVVILFAGHMKNYRWVAFCCVETPPETGRPEGMPARCGILGLSTATRLSPNHKNHPLPPA